MSSTRDRLLDAAADILDSDGVAQLNTNALAARAGFTPPTVYRHFKNKEEVMKSLAQRFIAAEKLWLDEARSSFSADSDLESVITTVIDSYWESAKRHRGVVALRTAMRVWPDLGEVEEESLAASTTALAGILKVYYAKMPRKELLRVARYAVELICSTVDRCYPLTPAEQKWRMEQLKASVVVYLTSLS
ncbi:MAG: TetR/AcrR family transcriptional regulator [Pseudomonadota bacterium]